MYKLYSSSIKNAMSVFVVVLLFCMTDLYAFKRQGLPSKSETQDIAWFDASNDHIIFCWGDGTIQCMNIESRENTSVFKIKQEFSLRNMLFVMSTTKLAIQNDRDILNIYNLSDGEILWSRTKPKDDIETTYFCLGFSSDEKQIYLSELFKSSILTLNSNTGELLKKEYGYESLYPYVTTDGEQVILCACEGDNKKCLQIQYPDNQQICCLNSIIINRKHDIPCRWSSLAYRYETLLKPRGTSDVVLIRAGCDGLDESIVAFSLVNRKILWEKNIPTEYLFAVTMDRKTQAFWENNQLRIRHLPDNNYIVVGEYGFPMPSLDNRTYLNMEEYNRTSSMAFTPDGNYLLYLPPLKILKDDYEKEVRYVGRESNELTVISCKTGQVVMKINNQKPNVLSIK